MKILLRIGVVAVFIVGGLVFRDRLGGSPAELQLGDCFDAPTTTGQSVKDVQHHPCSEGHTAEVILVTLHPAAKSAAKPTEAQLDAYLTETCSDALDQYVGLESAQYMLGAFSPTADGWKDGDRGVTCYLTLVGETPMTASVKRD